MYLNFFGLSDKPFSITPDIQYLFMGKQYEQALDTIIYGINNRNGFSMLTGEVGTGKTLMSRVLMARLDPSMATALLINPLLSVEELLKSITKDFGLNIRYNSPQKQIEGLNNFLLKMHAEGRNALVVIDEAQNLSIEALEMIRMLTNLETASTKLLQILLVGQPELLKKLKTHELRQLDQRITTRFHLTALTQTEMMRYINHRISIAGGGGKLFFEPASYKLIHKETKGYPRLINIVCDKALMSAYVKGQYIVARDDVKTALIGWRGRERVSPWAMIKRLVMSA